MPILNDITDHKVQGREYKRGRQEGLEEGIQEGKREGIREGIQEGELKKLRRLIQKRFGALPAWAKEKLHGRAPDLEELGVRLLDARILEDLFS